MRPEIHQTLLGLMQALHSWSFPGRPGWNLMFHVEHLPTKVRLHMWPQPWER